MSNPNRRAFRLVVEKDFQYRFALKICLVAGGLFLMFGGISLFIIKLNFEMLIEDAIIQMPDAVVGLRREFRLLSLGMVTSLILMIAILFGLGIALTQRIAGPLYALKKRLRDFGDGKRKLRLHFRSGDEFHNLEEAFNFAMENHERRMKTIEDDLSQLSHDLRDADPAVRSKADKLLEHFRAETH